MKMHRIADLNILLDYREKTMSEQAPPYETNENCEPDMVINLSDNLRQFLKDKNPHLDDDLVEYVFTGGDFFDKIVYHDGFMLHSSAVEYKGKAYLFSAPSGTGKSTHTSLWLKAFGDEARIINDDKPIIRVMDDVVYAYGTPWSGKTALNLNVKVPIGGICFIERGEKNEIEEIPTAQAIGMILNQTVRPHDACGMSKMLDLLDKVLRKVKVYKLKCNISEEAAHVAYNGMKGE